MWHKVHILCARVRERESVWVTSQEWWSNLCALLCWCPGSRVCVFSPCWSRTAPVMSSSTTACPGCARCSRSYRYGALDSLSNFFSFKCKIRLKKNNNKKSKPMWFPCLSFPSVILCWVFGFLLLQSQAPVQTVQLAVNILKDVLQYSSQLPELAREVGLNCILGILTSLLGLKLEVSI